ncbi:hypothetical protein THRCLA_09437 [Thraustotheca clavata]|uniref:Uncharacterized protein n=1 Tax=Thraustotheca clavata TaxID=74557 RepID=A0A1V9YW81_9STRA|nr:hypothetical protein THRCLA_09437 [Thraustotheca clavata]
MEVLYADTHVFATLLRFLTPCVNKTWSKAIARPQLWEYLTGSPRGPFLASCFRRASSYAYREIDVPAPGSPPTIRGCLLSDRSTIKDYINELRAIYYEQQNVQKPPKYLHVPDALYYEVANLKADRSFSRDEWHRKAFTTVKLIQSTDSFGHGATHMLSGAIIHEMAFFYLWDLKKSIIVATIYQTFATCFDICQKALVIGSTDGTVKFWDLTTWIMKSKADLPVHGLAPTSSLSLRSHLTIAPFLPTRSSQRQRILKVKVEASDGCFIHVAGVTERGDVAVWNATKGELSTTISSDKSTLHRALRESAPQVSSLMLFRNTLVVGTTVGLVRVFDTRDARLCHRISGHPDIVKKTLTRGRVLWSAGRDGSVRWWGGKSPKVLQKSALCSGSVSSFEMDDSVVVAAYDHKGMQAWDVRTQQPLATFGATTGIAKLYLDKRKLVSISMPTGVAQIWRWHDMYPVFTFPTSHAFVDLCADDSHLVLGTQDGCALVYKMEGTPYKKPTGNPYDY